jgi:pimeloyl-ACP methyl ester carboxylesterase
VKNAVSRRPDDARNLLQRLTFIYLATYLLVGGLGLLAVPELTLRLLLSSGNYGDVMPRLVGVFMIALQLELGQVVLVAHDASGPPAIDWALGHPERVAGLVLLNTYYCEMPTLRPPQAIWLFSTPVIRSVARPVSQMFGNWLFRRMYWWQVGSFIRDAPGHSNEFLPGSELFLMPGARHFVQLDEPEQVAR